MNRVDMTRGGARTMRPKMDQKRATTLMTVTPKSAD